MMKKYIERYWRKATKEDSIKDQMMDARFSNDPKFGFVISKLANWHRDNQWPWVDADGRHWNTAEVYDAPDPGEGYELIDPMTECPGPGLEFLYGQHWHPGGEKVLEWDTFYRRKVVQSPTLAGDATPSACKRTVAVRVNVDGKEVLVRPLLPSDEINSGDIWIEGDTWDRAYSVVGLQQSNVDRQFYREVRPQPKSEPEAAATKPEAAEPVTFVAHPIQFSDKGECLFYGKVIQERSYAVLNEQGHYLMWRLGDGPVYVPEFRQAFTPTQLRQASVRELGRNIRLRAVEPVDVEKLKQEYMQELKEKLAPKASAWEPKRQKVSWKGREYWVLTRFHVVKERGHDPTELAVLQDITDIDGDQLRFVPSQHFDKPQPEAPQPVKEPKYIPFTWDDRELLRGRWIKFKNPASSEILITGLHSSEQYEIVINDYSPSLLLEAAIFVDTGEPVGKRVED